MRANKPGFDLVDSTRHRHPHACLLPCIPCHFGALQVCLEIKVLIAVIPPLWGDVQIPRSTCQTATPSPVPPSPRGSKLLANNTPAPGGADGSRGLGGWQAYSSTCGQGVALIVFWPHVVGVSWSAEERWRTVILIGVIQPWGCER